MNLQDFDHFTLEPGETLILRARKPLHAEQLQDMQQRLSKLKFPVVVIPGPDFDMFAGMLTSPPADADAEEQAEVALCEQVRQAYAEGMMVQYKRKGDGENMWCDAQRAYLKHDFNIELNDYRMAPPRQ